MTRTYILTIEAEETDENIVVMLAGISYLSDNLPLDAVQVMELKDTGSNKLSTNKKLFQRIESDIDAGVTLDEDNEGDLCHIVDKDLILKNIQETLKEYDKYYDQKRIV